MFVGRNFAYKVRLMRKLLAIAQNTFTQTIRQPMFFIIILGTFLLLVLSVPLSGWTMDQGGDYHASDQKMLENFGLSTLLLAGLLLSAFSASSVLAREIEDKTALTVISKPVSRPAFVLGKFAGVAAAVTLGYYLCSLVLLLTVRHQVMAAAIETIDAPVLVFGLSGFALALILALVGNFLFGWSFTSASIWSNAAMLTLAMVLVLFIGREWELVPPGYASPPRMARDEVKVELRPGIGTEFFKTRAASEGYHVNRVDGNSLVYLRVPGGTSNIDAIANLKTWREVSLAEEVADPPVITTQLLKGMLLSYMGVLVFMAVAVTASTRLGQVMTLLICLAVFLLGSMGPRLAQFYDFLPARIAGFILPYLAYFYSTDVMSQPIQAETPVRFILYAGAYCLLYVAAVLALGIALFQRRQLAADTAATGVPGLVNLMALLGRLAALVAAMAGLTMALTKELWTPAGLTLAFGLLVAGILGWLLWGFFGRGAKWAYWLVLASAGGRLLMGIAQVAWPQVTTEAGIDEPLGRVAIGTLLAAAVLFVLILPKTRRHFFVPKAKLSM